MSDTLVERLREMNNRYIGLTTLDKELKALLTEAADALSAATERERGLRDALEQTPCTSFVPPATCLSDRPELLCRRCAALAQEGTPTGSGP
jgi:hypothetical protein